MSRQMTVREAGLAVVRRLREKGHKAYWAGGCVRDMLIGQEPADIDVATDAFPDRICDLFSRTRKVGAKFGVVMIRQSRHWIETATFRSDFGYEDGRHPERVVFTTAEEDAKRRDFTINGLFYDPIDDQIIDYVDGRKDLVSGIIRAIGDPTERFREDHLRMLRAVRFSTRFAFPIAPGTAEAIRKQAPRIERISPERIREELEKMLTMPSRATAVHLISELGLLEHLWPGANCLCEQIDLSERILQNLPGPAGFTLALAGLLSGRPLQHVNEAGRNLRCSNQAIDNVIWLVRHVSEVDHSQILPLPAFKKLLAHPRFDDLIALHKAICLARSMPLDSNDAAVRRRDEIPKDEVAPPPLVTGDDLIAMGLSPGPQFKQILNALYDKQLDNRLTTRSEAMRQLRTMLDASCGD